MGLSLPLVTLIWARIQLYQLSKRSVWVRGVSSGSRPIRAASSSLEGLGDAARRSARPHGYIPRQHAQGKASSRSGPLHVAFPTPFGSDPPPCCPSGEGLLPGWPHTSARGPGSHLGLPKPPTPRRAAACATAHAMAAKACAAQRKCKLPW